MISEINSNKVIEKMNYDKVAEHAVNFLDKARNPEWNYETVYPAKDFYQEGIKQPSQALLILQDAQREQALIDSTAAKALYDSGKKNALKNYFHLRVKTGENMVKAEKHSMVESSVTAFREKLKDLYPRSWGKRLAVIETGAVSSQQGVTIPTIKGVGKWALGIMAKRYTNAKKKNDIAEMKTKIAEMRDKTIEMSKIYYKNSSAKRLAILDAQAISPIKGIITPKLKGFSKWALGIMAKRYTKLMK